MNIYCPNCNIQISNNTQCKCNYRIQASIYIDYQIIWISLAHNIDLKLRISNNIYEISIFNYASSEYTSDDNIIFYQKNIKIPYHVLNDTTLKSFIEFGQSLILFL